MDKLDQICKTAFDLFVSDGYAQTPLSRIASAVGLTKAGLYHYFKSKEELLFLIHDRHLKKTIIPILEKAEGITDPRERIAYFIKAYTRHAMTEDASAKVLVHEVGNLMPQHRARIESVWKRALDLLRKAISEMEEAGTAKPLNRTFAAFAALGMCTWTFYWFDYERKEAVEELTDTYAEIFLEGLTRNG